MLTAHDTSDDDAPDLQARLAQLTRLAPPFRPPLVVLVAWGSDPVHAAVAERRGAAYAQSARYRVREAFTSYGEPMSEALLVDIATERFLRREVDYSRAWWLVPHSAVSLRRLEMARAARQQAWIEEAAAGGAFLSCTPPRADAPPRTEPGRPPPRARWPGPSYS